MRPMRLSQPRTLAIVRLLQVRAAPKRAAQPAQPQPLVQLACVLEDHIHEEVPGITFDRAVPLLLQPALLNAEKPSRVVRYSFPCQLLAQWTENAWSTLGGSERRLKQEPFEVQAGCLDYKASRSWRNKCPSQVAS